MKSVGRLIHKSLGAIALAMLLHGTAATADIGSGAAPDFTLASNSSLDGLLVLDNGSLDISGITLTLNGGMNWSGSGTTGSIIGSGPGSVLDIPGGATMNITTFDSGATTATVLNRRCARSAVGRDRRHA